MIRALLKMEWRSFLNVFRAKSSSNKSLTIIGYGLIALFLTIITVSFIISAYTMNDRSAQMVLTSYIIVYLCVVIFLVSIKQIIDDFFIATDIRQLLILPIGIQHIFMVKMLKLFVTLVLGLYLMVMIPSVITLYMMHHDIIMVVLLALTLLGSVLIALAVTFSVVYVLTKLMPKDKINEIMTGLLGLAGAFSYFIFIGPLSSIGGKVHSSKYLAPVESVSRSVFRHQSAVDYILPLSILIAGLAAFYVLWNVLMKFGQHDFAVQTIKQVKSSGSAGVTTPERALVQKDFKLIKRDFREISAILPQIIIPIPYFFFIIMQNGGIGELLKIPKNTLGTMMIGVAVAGTAYAVTVISASITAKDAVQKDVLYSLPIDFKDVVHAKWKMTAYLCAALFAVPLLIFGIVVKAHVLHIVFSLLLCIITSFAMAPLGIYFGTKDPQVSRKNPAKRVGTGTSFAMLFSVMGCIIMVVIIQMLLGMLSLTVTMRFLVFTVMMALIGIIFYMTMMKRAIESYQHGLHVTYVD